MAVASSSVEAEISRLRNEVEVMHEKIHPPDNWFAVILKWLVIICAGFLMITNLVVLRVLPPGAILQFQQFLFGLLRLYCVGLGAVIIIAEFQPEFFVHNFLFFSTRPARGLLQIFLGTLSMSTCGIPFLFLGNWEVRGIQLTGLVLIIIGLLYAILGFCCHSLLESHPKHPNPVLAALQGQSRARRRFADDSETEPLL